MFDPRRIISILISALAFSCGGGKDTGESDRISPAGSETAELNFTDSLSEGEIIVITDPRKVDEIARVVELKKAGAIQKALAELEQQPICYRYNNGDTSVIDELIDSLTSDLASVRKNIYDELFIDHSEVAFASAKKRSLYTVIINNLWRSQDEKAILQLTGHALLPEYASKFEERLYSGKSIAEDHILYYLSRHQKFCTPKNLDHLISRFRNRQVAEDDIDNATHALLNFADNGTSAMKKKAGEFCFEIYTNLLIDKSYFNNLDNTSYSYSPGGYILEGIFKYAGPESTPVLLHNLKEEFKEGPTLEALVRHEGKKALGTIIPYLRKKNKFYLAAPAAFRLYNHTKDANLLREIFTGYQKAFNKESIYEAEEFITACISIAGRETAGKGISLITDPGITAHAKTQVLLKTSTGADMARDLFAFGLTDAPYTPAQMKAAQTAAFEVWDDGEFSYQDFLEQSGIYYSYDEEEFSGDYADTLAMRLIRISRGKLNGTKVWLDYTTDEEGALYNLALTLIFNDKVYISKPVNEGGWYRTRFIFDLLNKVLKDNGIPERYYHIYSDEVGDDYLYAGIIFGEERKVKALAEKYFPAHKVTEKPAE